MEWIRKRRDFNVSLKDIVIKKIISKNQYKLLIGLLLIGVSMYLYNTNSHYNEVIKKTEPIKYKFISKKETHRTGGRRSYSIKIKYNDELYKVDISPEIYTAIDEGKLPEVYFSEKLQDVLSISDEKTSIRVSLFFLGFSIILILQYLYENFIVKSDSKNL